MAAIAQTPDIHTQAGARWLAPFALVVLGAMIAAFVMFLYPHITG
jgi:hypothetical protein